MISRVISALNIIGMVFAVYALWFVIRGFKQRPIPKDMTFLLIGLLTLGLYNSISNILEWSGISSAMDSPEDFFRLLEPMLYGNIFYAFFMFLSRRKIEESETKYRLLVENQTDMVVRTDAEGRFLFVSPSYCRKFGKCEEELLGRSFMPLVHPEDIAVTLEKMQSLKVPPYTCFVEQRAKTVDGWRWLAWADKAIPDEEGNITAIVGVGRDITDMKNAQEEKELLLQVLEIKNKELESIVYVASHDLRTPLVNIRGFGGELKIACRKLEKTVAEVNDMAFKDRLTPVQEEIAESLYFIDAGAAKMQALIDGLLEISRIGTASLRVQPLEMNRILKHIVSSMNYQIQQAGATVTVETLPSCRADARLINQVFTNLLDNAIKYRDPERPTLVTISGTQEGPFCIYRVTDNGIGIAPEHHKKIFEVFYRLNPDSKQTGEGLGLSIIVRILDRLGGSVRLESELGKGSTFIVSVPASESDS